MSGYRGLRPELWGGAFLAALTVVALLPWDPAGPFDARSYEPVAGVGLDYPWTGVLLEPLLAPAHAFFGAPDYRVAIVSFLVWLVVGALVAVFAWQRRRGAGRAAAAVKAVAGGIVAGVVFLGYVLALATLHMPGWQLSVSDPDLLVADLQSHTWGSHDGFVSPQTNLDWHAARGYGLAAVTEHNDPAGSFAAADAVRAGTPAVIAGVEVSSEEDEFLLGLGLDRERPALRYEDRPQEYARHFIDDVRDGHHGAVIAMAWRIEAANITRLARLGVDAFEIANTAHPEIPRPVREAMLKAERDGAVLVASTDWHGWSGFTRTWTLVRIPGLPAMDASARAAEVVRLLRQREQGAFIPVTAGRLEPPPLWRGVAAPLVETARYAAELSPARVISWWVWGLALAAVARRVRDGGRRPLPLFGAIAGLDLAALQLFAGERLLAVDPAATGAPFAAEIGWKVLLFAAAIALFSLFALFPRSRRTVPSP